MKLRFFLILLILSSILIALNKINYGNTYYQSYKIISNEEMKAIIGGCIFDLGPCVINWCEVGRYNTCYDSTGYCNEFFKKACYCGNDCNGQTCEDEGYYDSCDDCIY